MKVNNRFPSIEQVQDQYLKQNKQLGSILNEKDLVSFREILEQTSQKSECSELKFSKHASSRLSDRNINLTANQLSRLQEGTDRAQEKGIKESLVLMDELAFIVNIKNNTVITAMDRLETKENIFTNIDGAVII